MKQKKTAFYDILRSFFVKEFFSVRECIVILSLSLLIALWNKILSLLSSAQWGLTVGRELTVGQYNTLFSILVLWEVITVCVLALIPVMLILCIILWRLLKKNIKKLQEVKQQRGKITCHQEDRYKKGDRGKMYDILVTIFAIVFVSVTMWVAFFPVLILELYYGVFKQVRMYCRLRKELKSVLQEHDIAF
ncbi:hypothetical protein MCO_00588 [Bartonella sp. DB5-6]|uniref:hypothetical protein n=1 Tax=Bartonella sp. DB5-6 TaxID=1094755 RepID=UPI00026E8FBA|nr:hypothetical protein [Bartonella sp. DB5-6]EJF78603.1 hypothetical protein MCO_00588 [Bartonella sp. DB5-6]